MFGHVVSKHRSMNENVRDREETKEIFARKTLEQSIRHEVDGFSFLIEYNRRCKIMRKKMDR